MNRFIVFALLLFSGLMGYAGQVGLPLERMRVPATEGEYLICIWDDAANDWLDEFKPHDGSEFIRFQYPEWGKLYWVGLWDVDKGEYVFGRWIGHYQTDKRRELL